MSIPLPSVTHFVALVSDQSQGSFKSRCKLTKFQVCSEEEYHKFLVAKLPPGTTSFLQSAFWGHFKSGQGWQPHYFCGKIQVPELSGGMKACEFALLVLSRSLLPATFPVWFSLAYIPFGPVFFVEDNFVLDKADPSHSTGKLAESWNPFVDSQEYFAACHLIGQKLLGYIPLSCFFVRLDSNYLARWGSSDISVIPGTQEGPKTRVEQQAARDIGFYRAVQRVQVPDTVLLDLRYSEEELLAQMHKKHRYNIRLAQRKGVRVRCVDWQKGLGEWYHLYQLTAQRDKIGIHSFTYYRALFEQKKEQQARVFLYLAYGPEPQNSQKASQQKALGGIIVLYYAGTATYMYGASANEGRELMPNYLLQWQAICQARATGLQCYDFFGVPPHADPKHPLYGLYRFKVGFGGCLIQRCGAWDLAYGKVFYGIYCLLERGRLWLYQFRHRS